jgi:hypothetical protein
VEEARVTTGIPQRTGRKRSPLAKEGINKMWHIHSVECCSVIKMYRFGISHLKFTKPVESMQTFKNLKNLEIGNISSPKHF